MFLNEISIYSIQLTSRRKVLYFESATNFHNKSEDYAHNDVLDQSVTKSKFKFKKYETLIMDN